MYKKGNEYPVQMRKNANGDTRHATHIPTILEFDEANYWHQTDVKNLIIRFCDLLQKSSEKHDWSKTDEPYRSMFYQDMVATMEGRLDFENGEWAKLHYDELERHHLFRHVPEDVDLFDVIEMVCDCVSAGMARSGEVRQLEIRGDVLQKALENTVKILQEQIVLID